MYIGLTNTIRKFLHWRQLPNATDYDPLYCWDADRVTIDGRVMLVLCNVSNRFCCVTAMRGSDWRRLEPLCIDLIVRTMLAMGFTANAVDKYLQLQDFCCFEKTHGRKAMGCMGSAIVTMMAYPCDRREQFQDGLAQVANDDICHCATRADYGTPAEWMAEDLRDHGIDPYGLGDADEGADADGPAPEQPADACAVCGAESRVLLGSVPYCLSCFNRMVENDLGAPHVTKDNAVIASFDQSGRVVQFAVERFAGPIVSAWSAREILDAQPQGGDDHPGIEVRLYADPFEDQERTLSRLWDKVQKTLDNPSIKAERMPPGIRYSNGVHRGDRVLFACDHGWGRIEDAEGREGDCAIVIDGHRYTAQEFLRLFGSRVGFELHWSILDAGEEV